MTTLDLTCRLLGFIKMGNFSPCLLTSSVLNNDFKVSKGAKIRNRYNQVPHLTQDTNGKVTDSQ